MKIIYCSKLMDFSNTRRNYYNVGDIRLSDVSLYNRDDAHRYHKHNRVTEVLFVLEGSIIVKIKEDEKIKEQKVNKNNIAVIYAGGKHTVASVEEKARILVIKYIKTNEDLLETFLSDFEEN